LIEVRRRRIKPAVASVLGLSARGAEWRVDLSGQIDAPTKPESESRRYCVADHDMLQSLAELTPRPITAGDSRDALHAA